MNKIRLAIATAAIAAVPVAVAVAADVTPASALQACHSQQDTQTWSSAYCYDSAGPIRSIQAYAICIWPGQPNGIRQTVRGAAIYSAYPSWSKAQCPSGKIVYSYGASYTY